jgi:hypothetical protein
MTPMVSSQPVHVASHDSWTRPWQVEAFCFVHWALAAVWIIGVAGGLLASYLTGALHLLRPSGALVYCASVLAAGAWCWVGQGLWRGREGSFPTALSLLVLMFWLCARTQDKGLPSSAELAFAIVQLCLLISWLLLLSTPRSFFVSPDPSSIPPFTRRGLVAGVAALLVVLLVSCIGKLTSEAVQVAAIEMRRGTVQR